MVCFFEDFVVGLGPDEGVLAVVPAGDELTDLRVEVFHGCEDATTDRLPVDDPEPDLDEIQPRPRSRGEVHVEPWVAPPARSSPRGSCVWRSCPSPGADRAPGRPGPAGAKTRGTPAGDAWACTRR